MAVRPSISVPLSRINDLLYSAFKVFIYGFIGLLFPTTVWLNAVATELEAIAVLTIVGISFFLFF